MQVGQEGHQHHDTGIAEGSSMVNDIGNGSADTPHSGDDADEKKGDENILHGFHTGKSHGSHFPDGMLFEQAISEEQKKADDDFAARLAQLN